MAGARFESCILLCVCMNEVMFFNCHFSVGTACSHSAVCVSVCVIDTGIF